MLGAQPPVVVQPVKNGAGDEIVAGVQESAAQIPVADAPAPPFVRREGELMERQVQLAVVDVVTQLGFERNPRTRPEREVGIKVVERLLAAAGFRWPEPPVQQDVPIQQRVELAGALGLKRVAQAETDDIFAVNGINVVVIGKLDRQQQQAGQFGIELRQLRRRRARPRHKNVIHRRLDDVAQTVNVQN